MKVKKKRVLILSGGEISTKFLEEYLQKEEFEYVIVADSGLFVADKLKLKIDCILGDFDSVPKDLIKRYKQEKNHTSSYVIDEYDSKKDYTDTQIAIEKAIEQEPEEIVILGAIGTRLDHTLSNLHNLLIPLKKNIKCSLINEHNKLYIINKPTQIYKKDIFASYVSLLPLTMLVEKVTLLGFKYSLEEYDMHLGNSVGISNEIIEEEALINFDSGVLIVVESKDWIIDLNTRRNYETRNSRIT